MRRFNPPAGRFGGVIGGPPCQQFSPLINLARATGRESTTDNLIPEFERIVAAAAPEWFIMENVPAAPLPVVPGYATWNTVVNNRQFGEAQNRDRRFTFGVPGLDYKVLMIETTALQPMEWCAAILASGGLRPGLESVRGRKYGRDRGYYGGAAYRHALKAQGLPEDFLERSPFKQREKFRAVGNGVPIPMGRAIARAVRRAIEADA